MSGPSVHERELEAALARYRDLFEFAPDGYLVTDLEGRLLEANRAAERLLGHGHDELIGRPLMDLVPETYHRVFKARLEALRSGRASRVQDWQVTLEPAASKTFEAELTVEPTPLRGDDDAPPGTLRWLVRDVTERRRAEEALRHSTARARAILQSAVDGIVIIDSRGVIQSVNPAAERIFGYRTHEIVGRKVNVLMPESYAREHDGYLRNYLETGARKIIGIGREVVGQRKDGSLFPMDLAVSEVRVGGQRSFMGTVRDITERKQTERALRRERDFAESLVETAQTIVLVLDPEGRIVRYNRYMEDISGVPLDEVRGRDWFECFVPERERDEIRDVFSAAVAGEPTRGNVNPIVTSDGTERDIEWFDTLLYDPEGEPLGLLAVGQDLTPRKQLEEQVRQAQKLEAIGRLAGGIAHDFNTLLGSILGYGEMLVDDLAEDDPRRRLAQQIHRAAERGAALTGQLLAFSRRQVLEPRVLDLNMVVEEMDLMLQRLVGADVRLVHRLSPSPLMVRVDANQMEQVLMNLVVNACDAMPRGGTITLRTERVECGDEVVEDPETGGCALLAVEDTGCGMDEAVRSRAFEPFFTTKEPGKGTGLGLSTVYGIVTQSGGHIAVDSEVDRGTTFRMLLPLAQSPEAEEPVEAPAATGDVGSEVVLLVEDDPMFRELLSEVLVAKGYTVRTAGEPAEALEVCRRHDDDPPDLLITDMVMPGGRTGAELAEELGERYPELKVLLMSGYTDEALAQRGATNGGFEFIHKPFGTKELANLVRQLLDA